MLWQIKRLGAPALLPDGRSAVLPVTSYDVKGDKASTDLWLVPTTPGEARQLTSHEGSESGPAVSPDGKWVAFEAKRGEDENPQIYLLPLDGRGGAAPDQPGRGRFGPEVVPGQPAGGLHQPGVDRPRRPGTRWRSARRSARTRR